MKVHACAIPGPLVVTPDIWRDERGSFRESWHRDRYLDAGLPETWVQDNVSTSSRGVLRGLHFQWPQPQGKLVSVAAGAILDVAVDVRTGSPTFGRSIQVELTSENASQLFVPEGFAHGFLVLSDHAVVQYKCTAYYRPDTERTLLWSDAALGIRWPATAARLSDKDAAGRMLADFGVAELPSLDERS